MADFVDVISDVLNQFGSEFIINGQSVYGIKVLGEPSRIHQYLDEHELKYPAYIITLDVSNPIIHTLQVGVQLTETATGWRYTTRNVDIVTNQDQVVNVTVITVVLPR